MEVRLPSPGQHPPPVASVDGLDEADGLRQVDARPGMPRRDGSGPTTANPMKSTTGPIRVSPSADRRKSPSWVASSIPAPSASAATMRLGRLLLILLGVLLVTGMWDQVMIWLRAWLAASGLGTSAL